jgi:hypothetical protein
MVRTGLFSALCLLFLFIVNTGPLPGGPPTADDSIQNTLALQKAMESARVCLLSHETKKAVDVLENELPRVNGNTAFLSRLRDAYRGYIKDLLLENNATGAQRYLDRLCILEPGAAQDPTLRPMEHTQPAEPKQNPLSKLQDKYFPKFTLFQPKKDAVVAAVPAPPKPALARAKMEDSPRGDDDPFAPANKWPGSSATNANNQVARQLVAKAEEEFGQRRFSEACILYERACREDKTSVESSRDRWAYCMLSQVVDNLNQPNPTGVQLASLQQKVQGAVTMAPSLGETGRWLLGEIEQRQKTQVVSGPPTVTAQTTVRHLGRNKEGWQVTETPYFRIFHHQSNEQVEKVAAVAEKTRRDMYQKWFGTDGIEWSPKCELILHPTGNDYSRVTGVSGASPGHSRIERDPSGQRVVSRRMDLRCDNPGMLDAILPHETTHVVLAGMFGNHDVPRWCDEGIAVLTEPAYKVDQHRRNLENGVREGMLYPVMDLMQLENYPEPRRIGAFYAESVCLVEFLAEMRGPQTLTAFVRDGLREGYDSALRKHYGMDMSELQQRWQQRIGQGKHETLRP